MKYMIIGDLHGQIEIAEEVLSDKYSGYTKIFIGDYVDSFDRSIEDQIKVLKLVLTSCETRNDVYGLIGNHELSYIKDGMRCSGWAFETKSHIRHLEKRMKDSLLSHFFLEEDILITHAGATAQLFDDVQDVRDALEVDHEDLYTIGASRGGWKPAGGIFWCDFWAEFRPIEGLTQIVGHSAYRPVGQESGIVLRDNCYNIDCLDRVKEVLTYDSNLEEFNPLQLA